MHIQFPSVDEQFIKSMVENGHYSNATELVRDAVRHLREQQDQHIRLHAAIQAGLDDIKAGRTVPYTSDFMDKIMKEAKEMAKDDSVVYDRDIVGDGDE